ncbi:hypothetical protein [Amycolatopsis sp. SID8362]|uniref:hypothetical protein n=1 Tax=Amycolatopsis sp. SID8362 TaxID=2690346 RepID=UPI001369B3C6|nr:hypothetical protein [Amycolatopsis sp. SID8362]NBH02999.1 hypothetical protein [Amycolatopsis sp. SID8362]NED39700.1 hypothetical protein [Amycolatopsis sp. SID8362]
MRARMAAVAALAAVLSLSGCGETPRSSDSYQPATTSIAAAPTAPPAKTEYGAAATYKFRVRDGKGDGFTENVELSLGAPVPAGQAPGPLPGSCEVDLQRDLYIPLTLKVSNSTANFAYKVGYRFQPVQLDDDRVAGYLDAGTGRCVERFGLVTYEGPTLGVSSKAELPTGQQVSASGFLTYRGFFGPNGTQAAKLAKVFLDLGIRYDGRHGVVIDPEAGPGLIGYTGLDGLGVSDHYVIPVDGVTSPCTKGLFKREAHCA